ncbi:TetR/AcrR family transcriptional regulator [Propioniciclava coleopterorum]|uniref:TetR/AcrR family transcriptional regulator n=1 Tax=Propioniciclava coleopterorum TaxID=2714937 RepID=UPI00197F5CE3|nr:TetR/AcrR family transcriptional regulator [Propioniciclava coleopterorum]
MTEVTARRAATRDRLVEAALTVFAEKGVLGASVEEICEAAGFTRGAFYSNFASKDDLCVAALQRQFDDQMVALANAVASVEGLPDTASLDEVIEAALSVFFASRESDKTWVLAAQELRLHAARSPEMAAVYRESHRRGTEAVSQVIEQAVTRHGYELVASGPEAVGVLHAVHDYGVLGALIGSDTIAGDVRVRLLSEVLTAFVRPKA